MVALAKNIKSKKTPYAYGNYLDEVWTIDDRVGNTIASLNDGTGNQRHFYHCNTLFHIYANTDETGAIAEGVQSYDAYGKATIIAAGADTVFFTADDALVGTSAIGNDFFYTGQRLDAETGLMYYKNRYYSVDLGRFVSRDPIGYKDWRWKISEIGDSFLDSPFGKGKWTQLGFSKIANARNLKLAGIREDLNLYGYVEGSPTRKIDSEGESPLDATNFYFCVMPTSWCSAAYCYGWCTCSFVTSDGAKSAGKLFDTINESCCITSCIAGIRGGSQPGRQRACVQKWFRILRGPNVSCTCT